MKMTTQSGISPMPGEVEPSMSPWPDNDLFDGDGNFTTENPFFYGDDNVFYFKTPEDMLNPSMRNPAFYPIVITHAITFVLGIIGNVVAVSVMVGDRKGKSATNLFLVSLSVADLLLLILCIPLEVLQYFLQFEDNGIICKMARYTELLSASASVLNLCAVSLERFIVIVFPMRSRSVCTMSNCRKAVCIVWIVAIVLSLPVMLTKEGYSVTYTNNITSVSVYYCEEESVSEGLPIAIYKFVILFASPALLMMICYVYVIRELWRSARNINILTNTKSSRPTAHTHATEVTGSMNNMNSCGKKNVSGGRGQSESLLRNSNHQSPEQAECGFSVISDVNNAGEDSLGVIKPISEANSKNGHNGHSPFNFSKFRGFSKNGKQEKAAYQQKKMHNQSKAPKGEDAKKTRKQVIKMLILIIILFLVCWGPKLILNITLKLALIFGLPIYSPEVYLCRVIFSLVPFVHSCINPIVYSFMSKNFRRSMSRQLGRCCIACGCKCGENCIPQNKNPYPMRSTARARTNTMAIATSYSNNFGHPSPCTPCTPEMNSTKTTQIEDVSAL